VLLNYEQLTIVDFTQFIPILRVSSRTLMDKRINQIMHNQRDIELINGIFDRWMSIVSICKINYNISV